MTYTADWTKYRCSDFLKAYSTNSLSWDKLSYKDCDGILNLHYGLIHNGAPTLINTASYNLPLIIEDMPKAYELCKNGDVIFADASEDTNDICKPVEIYETNGKSVISGLHTIHTRDYKDLTCVGFKGYLFSSKSFHKQVFRLTQGTKIFSISFSNFREMSVSIPQKEEQLKIVEFLSKIDDRISTQSKIIEDLNIEKKVISDKIFSQKSIRKELLCSFYNKGKAGGTPKSTNKKYYDGDIPFLSISDMTEQGKYLYRTQRTLTQEGLENSTAWIVPENSLILSMYASVGQVAINKIPLATSQAMFSMTLKDKNTVDFLYYYLSYFRENKLHKYLETGTQSNINAHFVKSIEIPNYGDSKNKQIVSLLSLMDERIQKEKDILALYKKQKAYLLSNMFI